MQWNAERILVYRKEPTAARTRTRASAVNMSRAQRVGIWDLDASAGQLPHLLDLIEERQDYFSFYSVEAAFQVGLTLPGSHVALEWKQRTGGTMTAADAAKNVSARRIYAASRPVLAALPIDWLIVVVKSMISDASRSDPWHNLFSTGKDRISIVSTFELREYAAKAGRPFEAAVAGISLAMLLSQMVPAIEWQEDSTGSIFDFCEVRSDLVRSLRHPTIDPQNKARIPHEILEPTEKVLALLKEYKGNTTAAQMRRQVAMSSRTAKRSKALLSTKRLAVSRKSPQLGSFDSVLKSLSAALPKTSNRNKSRLH